MGTIVFGIGGQGIGPSAPWDAQKLISSSDWGELVAHFWLGRDVGVLKLAQTEDSEAIRTPSERQVHSNSFWERFWPSESDDFVRVSCMVW